MGLQTSVSSFAVLGLVNFVAFSEALDFLIDDRCLYRRSLLESEEDHNDIQKRSEDDEDWIVDVAAKNGAGGKLRGAINITSTDEDKTVINKVVSDHRDLQNLRTEISSAFNMKLYWQEGYCWQEEWREREWCMQCDGRYCDPGDILWLQECRNIPQQRFTWISDSSESNHGRLKTLSQDLCLEKVGTNAFRLDYCDYYKDSQLLVRSDMSSIFELHPADQQWKCINNHHHPREFEEMLTTSCATARKWSTSKWEAYWPGDSAPGPYRGNGINLFDRDPQCGRSRPCGKCDGDCDSDDECEGNLKCRQRDYYEDVPGCRGLGEEARDYCYDEADEIGNIDDRSFNPDPELLSRAHECSASEPCGLCQGDCDSDRQCEGSLKCFQRQGFEAVPGCSGWGVMRHDYCTEMTPDGTNLFLHNERCSESQPCGMCEGKCKFDSDCDGDLVCFHRIGNTEDVPGCSGTARSGKNYCVAPAPDLLHLQLPTGQCSIEQPCPKCEGDCDNDDECEGDLKCFLRDGFTAVPGCKGVGNNSRDYCYEESPVLG